MPKHLVADINFCNECVYIFKTDKTPRCQHPKIGDKELPPDCKRFPKWCPLEDTKALEY
jgi:hypothetical protein